LNRRGVAARSTTSDHLVVLEDSAQPYTKLGGASFGRYSVLGYGKTPVPPPGYLSNKWISRILHKRNNKPTSTGVFSH
jgi:hypothetical protein